MGRTHDTLKNAGCEKTMKELAGGAKTEVMDWLPVPHYPQMTWFIKDVSAIFARFQPYLPRTVRQRSQYINKEF